MEREELQRIIDATPFARLLDARLEDFEPGKVSLWVPLDPRLTMHLGCAHGAVVGFMADSACAWSAASLSGEVVTGEYKLSLLGPAIGERLFARGQALQSTGCLITCRADVFTQDGGRPTRVATALATIVRLR